MSDTRQAGGHKSNRNNPNTSQESKQHSRDILEGDSKDAAQRAGQDSQEGKNPGNGTTTPAVTSDDLVAGGYKATLKNPNSSEDAKKHAKQQLDNM